MQARYGNARTYPSLHAGQRTKPFQGGIQALNSTTPKHKSRQQGARQAASRHAKSIISWSRKAKRARINMGVQPLTTGNRFGFRREGIPTRPTRFIETPDHVGPRRLEINVISTYPYIRASSAVLVYSLFISFITAVGSCTASRLLRNTTSLCRP